MSALSGIVIGGALGGVVGYFATKAAFGKADVGVTAAAAGAGALIGGAIAGPAAAASEGPTLQTADLNGQPQFYALKPGDVLDLKPPAGLAIASVNAHGSDAVTVDTSTPTLGVVRAVKPKGARLDVALSNGQLTVVNVSISA